MVDTDSEYNNEVDSLSDTSKLWLTEFNCYFNIVESVPEGMSIIEWWGVRTAFIILPLINNIFL